jgi:FixJ family two-component response regulator
MSSETQHIAMIDSDSRRRAGFCHAMAGTDIHVEPFEDTSELIDRWPRLGVVLCEDTGDNIANLVSYMTETAMWLPLIAFSEKPATQRVVRAIMDGAIDYIEWPIGTAQLSAVITEAESNSARIGSLRLREARARSRVKRLTRREREVLEGVAGGLSNRMIGEKLAISPRTVEIHRANMLTKMGANHTSEAIRIAIEAALVA